MAAIATVQISPRPVLFPQEVHHAGIDPTTLPVASVAIVTTRDVWIRERIDEWWVAYRLVIQNGAAVVGEVRIFPFEPEVCPDVEDEPYIPAPRPGEWSGMLRGLHASVPGGGLTSRVLRRVRLGAQVFEGRRALVRLHRAAKAKGKRSSLRQLLDAEGLRRLRPDPPPRTGGRGRPARLDLARIAAVYRTALANGSSAPVQQVARVCRLTLAAARMAVSRARRRGFLPPTIQGRMRSV